MGLFPENPCEFAVEFVRRMRHHPDIVQIPSSRQVLSIPRLILSRYYRNGSISANDFIDISTVTSFPDNQKLAKEISFQILFPNYNKDMVSSFFDGVESNLDIEEDEFLDDYEQSELDKLQDMIDEMEMTKNIDSDFYEQLEEFINDLNQKREEEPYKSALNFFNDDSELYKNEISSLEDLMKEAKKRLEEKINSLNPEDLKAGSNLDLNDFIEQNSKREWEKITSKALSGQDIRKELERLKNNNNFEDLIQSLKYLKESDALPKEQLENLKNDLLNQIENLDQLFNAAKNLGETPNFDQEKILNNSCQQNSFEHNFNLANTLDQHFGTTLRSALLDKMSEMHKSSEMQLSMETLAKNALASKAWNDLFNQSLDQAMQNASNQKQQFEAFKNLTHQLQQLMNSCSNLHCGEKMSQKLPEMVQKSLESCQDPNQLKNTVEFLRNIGLKPDAKDIEKKGKQLGMPDEEIFELIEPDYQLLKKLIDKNVQDFDRISNLMNQIKDQLNKERIEELMKGALSSDNREALGALGHFDLEQALKAAQKVAGNEGMDQTISCLTAGSGENMLKQWFVHRHKLPSVAKEKVKELAKKMLIELGIYYSRARLGSAVSGPVPINVTRPYTVGDDFDNIDLEETIYNLLEKGKKLDHINYDDFFVHETARGLRSLCIELDVSGSMSGEKLTYMAICVSMLVYGLKKDEIAITFFESNTHVLKELNEEVNLEKLADDLLSVEAKGGTVVQSALEWARRQFKENSSAREKLNVLFTDAEIYDIQKAAEELRIFRSLGVDFILVCPETQYNLEEAKKIVKIAGGQLLTIKDWNEFPQLISDIIKSKF